MSGIVLTRTTDEFVETMTAAFAATSTDVREVQQWGGFDPLAIDELVADRPDVVAIGPAVETDDALKLVEELDLRHPEVSVVLVAQPNADLWPQALRAGVRDVVAPYTAGSQLREAFTRAADASQRLREVVAETATPEATGHIVAVISPKGGCGKTTVATNMAATLARHRPDEVVVADLDLQFGDVSHALHLDPEYSMLHASAEGVSPTVLKGFLASHPGRVFSRSDLLNRVIGETAIVLDRNIDVHVRAVRQKLGKCRDMIQTVRSVGYRFRD